MFFLTFLFFPSRILFFLLSFVTFSFSCDVKTHTQIEREVTTCDLTDIHTYIRLETEKDRFWCAPFFFFFFLVSKDTLDKTKRHIDEMMTCDHNIHTYIHTYIHTQDFLSALREEAKSNQL